jgi:hypothetical protein
MEAENFQELIPVDMPTFIGVKIITACPEPCPSDRYKSKVGDPGYMVKYEDGYTSWSPQDAFEAKYRRTNNMNFGLAIEAMRKGYAVARKGWNGKGIYCKLQVPGAGSKMTSPYIYIDTTGLRTDNQDAPKILVPWLASQTDMLADDWTIMNF